MSYGERPTGWLTVAAAAAVALGLCVGCDRREPAPPGATARNATAPADKVVAEAVPAQDGIALAIVYDTSGSMGERVKNAAGESEPKYVIAARALNLIIDRLAKFSAAPTQPPRRLEVGLWVFTGALVSPLQPMAPFDSAAIRRRVAGLEKPHADTPLGEGLADAASAVLASKLSRRHVLVITDGMNTHGRDPAEVLPGLLAEAKRRDTVVGVHFVAFDVAASVFEPLKRLGATVLPATDERTLGEQLGFILERKILLEDEEPAAGPK